MEMKQRIIGIIVLVALAVLLVPLIFDSEVALPPPNHLPVANATVKQPANNEQKTVAYQAPTIKPAQIQQASDKTLVHNTQFSKASTTNEINEHEDIVVEDDNQIPYSDDEILDKPEKPAETAQNTETNILPKEPSPTKEPAPAKETANKAKSSNDELVKEAALKLAIQKEDSQKRDTTDIQNHRQFKFTSEKSEETKIVSEKIKSQNKLANLKTKQKTHVASTSGGWVIQLGSFSEQANANKLANRLKSKGFNAFTERDRSRKNIHRVLVGPSQDRIAAEKTLAQLKNDANIHGIIVRVQR